MNPALIFIILVSLQLINISASSAYSREKLTNFYKDFYKEELGIGFWKKLYKIRDPKLRKEILDYVKANKLEASNQEINTEWMNFISKNFPNPKELKIIAKDNYFNLDQAKTKFIEDLDLEKYFETNVKAKLKKDFDLRDRLLKSVITNQISDLERLEYTKQFLAVHKLNNLEELETKYSLGPEELDFLITSNFLIEKRSSSIYNLDLEKRVHNLVNNSNMNEKEARSRLLNSYRNQVQYLY